MRNIALEHRNALVEYLQNKYDVHTLDICLPFLICYCSAVVSDPHCRPFIVASYPTVWLQEGDPFPLSLFPGNFSGHQPPQYIQIHEQLAADLRPYHIPAVGTLTALAEYFPEAQHISFVSNELVVELRKETPQAYREHLLHLPTCFANSPLRLHYHNGPLTTTELRRGKQPKPQLVDGEYDDVDYVKDGGRFFPGTMITSGSASVSAGIFVTKDNKSRLTVAFHGWGDEYESSPQLLGDKDHFRVTQGQSDYGTNVGYVDSRIGDTDIGLCKLFPGLSFTNQFLEINTRAQTLLHSSQVEFGDIFHVDSFVTGLQELECFGVRVSVEGGREKPLVGKKQDLPGPGTYVALVQGIYATSAPEIGRKPQIRESICGSAIVRATKADGNASVLDRGEIAGFFHWSDLRRTSSESTLLCFCDSVDELIDAGWSAVVEAEST